MRGTLEERFWAKVDQNGPNGCWVWTACRVWNGYGLFSLGPNNSKYAHRLAYEWLIGPIPHKMELDHVCHNRACVNPSHIRVCTHSENSMNRVQSKNNSSGFKGASWHKTKKKWVAYIKIDQKMKTLGGFDTKEEAYAAYCEAASKLFGEFANFG